MFFWGAHFFWDTLYQSTIEAKTTEIHVCDFLRNGTKNNSKYMCENIWPAIDQNLREKRPVRGAK